MGSFFGLNVDVSQHISDLPLDSLRLNALAAKYGAILGAITRDDTYHAII